MNEEVILIQKQEYINKNKWNYYIFLDKITESILAYLYLKPVLRLAVLKKVIIYIGGNKMVIREVNKSELNKVTDLVWKVFIDFEADDYSKEGIKTFKDFLHNSQAIEKLKIYGAYINSDLVGIIAMRNNNHIALFFVDGNYHRQGIGRKLLDEVMKNIKANEITVNSSPYAIEIYCKLGFIPTSGEQLKDGIRFTPMLYKFDSSHNS